MLRHTAILAAALSVCACSSTSLDQANGDPNGKSPIGVRVCCARPEPKREEAVPEHEPALSANSVYFDFDQYAISEKYQSVVKAHAAFLTAHPDRYVQLIGNTDDQGGPEYNLGLGQKRADTVANQLILLGVDKRHIETVSFGAERPRATGDDETSRAENRRVDFFY
ncbi:OmpA family protein [Herbaspirillum sp.]|uniref:OmpA family protein n=1 Tax=Herbaspirillum sp. TaxID=1890675 RepID=UPI0031DF886A